MKIRKLVEADYQNLYETISDSEVMKFVEKPYSEEKTKVFLQETGLCDIPLIYAAEDDKGHYVGYVIYHDYESNSVEIGWILKRAEWGKGYAKALTELMLERAKHDDKDVVIEFAPGQEATRHIASSFGFVNQGIVDGCCLYRLNRDRK